MGALLTLYSGSVGMNNRVFAHRLLYNDGVTGLEDAENIIIDNSGQVVTRRGYTQAVEGEFHSLFSVSEWGLVAKDRSVDTALYRVDVTDGGSVSLTGLRSSLSHGSRIDYCITPEAVYYTNGYENGAIVNGVSVPWKESIWPNKYTEKEFAPVPPSNHLAFNSGRIFFSIKNVLYYTEFGLHGIYDPAINGEVFDSTIVAIVPISNGLFVSDTERVYYLSGLNPKEWELSEVLGYPLLEWGGFVEVDPLTFGIDIKGKAVLLATLNGPAIGLPGGRIINLIDKSIKMVNGPISGAIFVSDDSLVIQTGE